MTRLEDPGNGVGMYEAQAGNSLGAQGEASWLNRWHRARRRKALGRDSESPPWHE